MTTTNHTGNLGPERDAFFGRARDLETLRALFDAGAALVTILGPGGIGKTRFAKRFALEQKARFASAWFCDLSSARNERDIVVAMSRTLGAALKKSADAVAQLGEALREKENALVIIDNCEQVIAEVAPMVSAWMDQAPHVHFLATSREALHVNGERTHVIEPLTQADGALQLFVDRARLVKPGWSPDDHPELLARALEKLEGIPLAIELAAARMRVLDTKTLAERLTHPLDVLSTGPRAQKERHGSLRSAIEWSWTICEDWEQRALAQASIFESGFSLEAAEAVIAVDVPVLDVLHALADKSLLRAYEPEGFPGELRYRMLETVREFAGEKLASTNDAQSTHARHAAFYLRVGTEWEGQTWHGGVESPRRLALDLENLLSIHARARHEKSIDALRAGIALFPIFATRGPFDALVTLLDPTLDEPLLAHAAADLRARYLIVRGRSRQMAGRRAEGATDFSAALREARKTSDGVLTARALVYVGTAERFEGRLADARDRFEAAVRLFEENGEMRASAVTLSALGAIDLVTGELSRARLTLLRAIDTLANLGDRSARAMVQIDFGLVEQERGDLDAARAALEQALAVHTEIGNRRFTGIALGYRAGVELEANQIDAACTFYEQTHAALAGIGDPKLEALFHGAHAAALAMASDLEAAEAHLAIAERAATLQGEPRIAATVSMHRGHLDIARGDRNQAQSRRVAAAGLASQSDDVRFALRLLDAALGSEKSEAAISGTRAALIVARDISWFRLPGSDARVDLGKRVTLKRIIAELVRRRVDHPGIPVSREDLVAVGWPGEKLGPDAAFNRLGVALSELRRSGWRALLLHRDGGHLLDPDVAIELESDD